MEEILTEEATADTNYVSGVVTVKGMLVDRDEQEPVVSHSIRSQAPPTSPGVCSQTDKGI